MRPPRALSEASRRIRPAVFSVLQARIDLRAAKGQELIPLQIGDTHLAPPYLFLDFAPAFEARRSDRAEPLYEILERAVDRGVLLAPGEAFGAAYKTFARLCSTSVPVDCVVDGVERLCEAALAYVRGG